jgi:hypothetical protein
MPLPEWNARIGLPGRQSPTARIDPFRAEKHSELNRLTWQTAPQLDSRLRNESIPIFQLSRSFAVQNAERAASGACAPNPQRLSLPNCTEPTVLGMFVALNR